MQTWVDMLRDMHVCVSPRHQGGARLPMMQTWVDMLQYACMCEPQTPGRGAPAYDADLGGQLDHACRAVGPVGRL